MTFKEYKGLDLVSVGNEVLEKWKKNQAFEKSLELREGAPEFIFFEGPPSANGMPGIHHVMARSIKDAICRYKTQSGYKVRRRAGWDTHGLPVELGVEKKLGITKEDIGTKISVEEYNATCRSEVMKYTAEWRNLTERIGYWVDMDDPYITYDNRYIETLWYLLKDIYGKGYLYKGKSIQPYSPAAGTGLSSHELNQPGCYRDVKDTTCCAQFKVVGEEELYFLAWTTTPWTLPSNTALCVGPGIDYVKVRSTNPYTGAPATYILAQALVGSWFNDKIPYEVLPGSFKGTELEGMRYEQLIPWFNPGEGAFRVILGDYVTTEDGTGIVHIAPTFGADDAKVAKAAGVPGLYVTDANGDPQAQVDPQGRFYRLEDLDKAYVQANVNEELYREWAGRYVKNAYDASLAPDAPTLDVDICVMLKGQNKAFRIEKHVHTYPHCWRTDKPVLYYPLNSWFIKASAVREQMMELNEQITWKPEATGTGRFGKWLENIQDWNLSRSRYWGTPLPIWRTEDGKEEICIGSVKELYNEIEKAVKAGFMESNPLKAKGFDPEDMSKENYDRIDLHRPYVDRIFLVSPSGRKMTRESDLIDVWFDSGSMPYAQLHYPFEGAMASGTEADRDAMIHSRYEGTPIPPAFFPADFINEGVDQTRGWFFTLHAIATMVFDSVAFKNVISTGLVLDAKGNKMSKHVGNVTDPFEMMDKYGADPVRFYMMTNSEPWDNLKFDPEGVDEVRRKFFGTLYNTYSFFALYANVDGFDPDHVEGADPIAARPEIDRWIISKVNSLVLGVQKQLDSYDPTRAGRLIDDFVNDDLSNWFVRLNRKRFWGKEMDSDKLNAYDTLYTCLMTVAKLLAPFAPFYADRLYQDLGGKLASVHLERFPVADTDCIDKSLEARMDIAQKITSMVLALRRKVNIKVRQPLAQIMIPAVDEEQRAHIAAVKDLIQNEVNVKAIDFVEDSGFLVKKVKCNFRVMGKKYGKMMKGVAAKMAALSQEEIATLETAGSISFAVDGEPVTVDSADVEIISEDIPGWLVSNEGNLTVALEVELTDELRNEGMARELINRIQNMRKDAGLEIVDRIEVKVAPNEQTDAAISAFCDYIKTQVLADSITIAQNNGTEVDFDDFKLNIQIARNS